jgi:uncharacterized protein (TIGR02147 family)
MLNVFNYQDYRKFLADYYKEKKTSRSAFSYLNFSRKAGFTSKSFVFNVINGRKNLSSTSVVQLSQALGLGKKESAFFETLVYYNQAKSFNERNFYYEKLNALRPASTRGSSAWQLREDQYEFYSNWYHAVIRSLIDMFPDVTDFRKLAKMVSPAIRPKQAEKSIKLLLRLGLIDKKNGTYKISEKSLTTGEDVQSLAVQTFHLETMKLAEKAIKMLPKNKRNISGLTLGISTEAYSEICNIIYECQKKIMDVANKDEKSDRVYQLNFHLFPVSKLPFASPRN